MHMADLGLQLESMKGLEFIPTPPAPHAPLTPPCPIPLSPPLTQVDPFVHTHKHTRTHNYNPMSPHLYQHLFFIHKVEVMDQVFKRFIFLSLTCVFYPPPPHNSLGCIYFILFWVFFFSFCFFFSFLFFWLLLNLEANILNGYGTGLGSGCEENPLFLHKPLYIELPERLVELCVLIKLCNKTPPTPVLTHSQTFLE